MTTQIQQKCNDIQLSIEDALNTVNEGLTAPIRLTISNTGATVSFMTDHYQYILVPKQTTKIGFDRLSIAMDGPTFTASLDMPSIHSLLVNDLLFIKP